MLELSEIEIRKDIENIGTSQIYLMLRKLNKELAFVAFTEASSPEVSKYIEQLKLLKKLLTERLEEK